MSSSMDDQIRAAAAAYLRSRGEEPDSPLVNGTAPHAHDAIPTACPVCGACEPLPMAPLPDALHESSREEGFLEEARLADELRQLKIENSRLRRESSIPTQALAAAAQIISLEEQLAESEKRAHEVEIAHAEGSNVVIHQLEEEIRKVTEQRDGALHQIAQLTERLVSVESRLKHEALVRLAEQQQRELIEHNQAVNEAQDSHRASPSSSSPQLNIDAHLAAVHRDRRSSPGTVSTEGASSPVLSPSGDSGGFEGSRSRLSSVRRALRRSKEAVMLSLPRAEPSRDAQGPGSPRGSARSANSPHR